MLHVVADGRFKFIGPRSLDAKQGCKLRLLLYNPRVPLPTPETIYKFTARHKSACDYTNSDLQPNKKPLTLHRVMAGNDI